MGLDFLTTPTYELTLPSSKKKIKYRPFIVKEEKLLLMALQENQDEATFAAVRNLILSCTFDEIDIKLVPIVDAEFLFVNIRNKSLGEGIELNITCSACGKKTHSEFNLEQIEVTGGNESKTIQLEPNLKVVMREPTMSQSVPEFSLAADNDASLVAHCIEFIEHDGTMYETGDYTIQEKMDFVYNLTQKQLRKIDDWLGKTSRICFKSKVKCSSCGVVNDVQLVGMNDFFG